MIPPRPQIKVVKLADNFGQYIVVIRCECGHNREARPSTFAAIAGWDALLSDVVKRLRCSEMRQAQMQRHDAGGHQARRLAGPGPGFRSHRKQCAAQDATLQAEQPGTSIEALYRDCNAKESSPAWAFCAGYIAAQAESMIVLGQAGESEKPFGICPAPGISVSGRAAIQAFKNWAEKHPERWGQVRHLGVAFALGDDWPCAKH